MTTEICPADLPEEKAREMQRIALEAVRVLSITGYGRMDASRNKEIFPVTIV